MKSFIPLFVIFLLFSVSVSNAQSLFKKVVQDQIEKNDQKDSTANVKIDYDQLIKESQSKKGFFTSHFTKEYKLYWEIPDSAFNHTYMLSNRIAETSNTHDYVAGQMVRSPLLIRFSKNEQSVFMHQIQTENILEKGDPIEDAFKRNFKDPVLKGFKIVSTNGNNVVIDVTAFFGGDEKSITPIMPENPLARLFGGKKPLKGTFVADASAISEVKNFPKNMEIRSMLSYATDNEPYTVTVHRSLVLLPDNPMPLRLQDNRVGYFSSDKFLYTTLKDKVEAFQHIHRWRLQPRKEDMQNYFSGKLVEPEEPIVFYVDAAFPEKWRGAVKQGIEDWNAAFETAGFKNAIKAVDYPANDPDFDPDDMRYSCIKYAATTIANAMGPSHVDPRTGEILNADVIWYHNIISLLHNWRFIQTSAVDPRVRKTIFSDEVMCESMRYVSAHEIGHTLGLMHNMGASYSFPVDSLRSSFFTQKYGTTPSIMDYARNNYVAQPGDVEKGVKLTPPILGVYDIFSIQWGYKLIPEARNPEDELPVLSSWVREKQDDPMYKFGAQQFLGMVDPSDQTEDLGNDHILAGEYGIKNLRITLANLEEWVKEDGRTFDDVKIAYNELVNQYSRYIRHVMPYIGGIVFNEIRQGESGVSKDYISKAEQNRAMNWLLDEARSYDNWLNPSLLFRRLDLDPKINDKIRLSVIGCLFNSGALARIAESEQLNTETAYPLNEYMDDLIQAIFKNTYAGKSLNNVEIDLQTASLDAMIKYTGLQRTTAKTGISALSIYEDFCTELDHSVLVCNHSYHSQSQTHSENDHSFMRINYGLPTISANVAAPLMTAKLKSLLDLYKKRRKSGDQITQDFYNYQIIRLEQLFQL